eukprot:CAMPEP_0197195996 /NCGR_PEP_ID=MMETSP1423-20130617/32117_1 /TAXON_ID=476441 /ORGANISM="Pseudo-nitzschia heimii, Strain UNC1101" /LENGTH=371 /DNA_ID=CAMNT_0042649759 /DNA_START=141 /DNA_END=1253 /DNA_ORIENTATION=+
MPRNTGIGQRKRKKTSTVTAVASAAIRSLDEPSTAATTTIKEQSSYCRRKRRPGPGSNDRRKQQKRTHASIKRVSVTADVVKLFIELDELEDTTFLKKAISFIRERLETAANNAVEVIEVIDVDTDSNTRNNAHVESTATTAEAVEDEDEDEVNTTAPQPTAAPVPTVQTEVAALTTPSPVHARRIIPSLIPLNLNSFQQQSIRLQDVRGDRNESAEKVARYRAVKKIVDAVLDPALSLEQQVLALRLAIRSKILEQHSISAGLIIDNEINYYLVNNLKSVLQLANTTTKERGRPTDDMRSLIQTIVLATLPSPNDSKKNSMRTIAEVLGIPWTTYRRAVKAVKVKRAALEGFHIQEQPLLFSQVVKRKGW